MSPRYALYLAPDHDSALWRFGSCVLGYDAESGAELAAPPLSGFEPKLWHRLTVEPRQYGFHGTLKAPFRLAEGKNRAALDAALDAFGRSRAAFELPPLVVRAIGSFVALVPLAPVPALNGLAQAAVEGLDGFRAPLNPSEIAKRKPERLSERQRGYLERYGYPYVGEDFRFHMTLTGSLEEADRVRALEVLTEAFAASGAQAVTAISQLALYEQPAPGERFRLVRRVPFALAQAA